jgi:predicted nucleic acid-binding protein
LVVDTNIVVYYLNQVGGDDFRRRFGEIVEKGAVISVITRIEVLSWPGYADVSPAMAVAEALLSILREEPLTDSIVQAAIVLRRNYRIQVPDAIVAATAKVLETEALKKQRLSAVVRVRRVEQVFDDFGLLGQCEMGIGQFHSSSPAAASPPIRYLMS